MRKSETEEANVSLTGDSTDILKSEQLLEPKPKGLTSQAEDPIIQTLQHNTVQREEHRNRLRSGRVDTRTIILSEREKTEQKLFFIGFVSSCFVK